MGPVPVRIQWKVFYILLTVVVTVVTVSRMFTSMAAPFDTPRPPGTLTGTSFMFAGFMWVFAGFDVRDVYLWWLGREDTRRPHLDREGMRRDARHPDWSRGYQKKPRIHEANVDVPMAPKRGHL